MVFQVIGLLQIPKRGYTLAGRLKIRSIRFWQGEAQWTWIENKSRARRITVNRRPSFGLN